MPSALPDIVSGRRDCQIPSGVQRAGNSPNVFEGRVPVPRPLSGGGETKEFVPHLDAVLRADW